MPKSVLISGASSGIGKAISLELDRQGYQVFAGVRSPSDADALREQSSSRLTPVLLDITIPEMVRSACDEVSEKTGGALYCLINNAGISLGGTMEFLPIQDFRQQFEVNVTGQLALTQACLPMLRQGAGRIIFVSSVAGRLVAPFNGPYSASKAALVAVADAFRLELAPWGIFVTAIIIGSVQTPIWEKSSHKAREILHRTPEGTRSLYGIKQKRAGAFYRQTGQRGMKVEKVVQIIQHVLETDRPKGIILAGRDAYLIELMAKLLPVRLRDWLVRRRMGLLEK